MQTAGPHEFVLWPGPGAPVSAATWLRELKGFTKCLAAPPAFPDDATAGNGEPVLLVPAFLSPDLSTAAIRTFLRRQQFSPEPWGCGINFGPTPHALSGLEAKIRATAQRSGRKISVVGVSLGGTLAREAAKRAADCIERLITVASPINFPVMTPLAPLARLASLFWDADMKEAVARVAEPPPVPLTAIVSLSDGILDWRACMPRPSAQTEVVALTGDHMTMGSNPEVLRVIAARLAGYQNRAG
jgi:pimeloyl-ACP methyl ester carboxylesterase